LSGESNERKKEDILIGGGTHVEDFSTPLFVCVWWEFEEGKRI
jgi:hypothetical protein